MADTSFPTTLADLNFRFRDDDDDAVSSPSLYRSIRDLRKATLSIPNRLRSVVQDAAFVQRVVEEESLSHSPPSNNDDRSALLPLPLIANERCGSWYIPPARKAGSAYFKSTDGHYGQWAFSPRRLNLQVLRLVGERGGAVVVDSTRRGKSVPDALAKTVPIWVAVVNRVLFPDCPGGHELQRGPGVGDSETAQIEDRLGGFVRDFEGLGLDLVALREEVGKPIRLSWRVNDDSTTTVFDGNGALGCGFSRSGGALGLGDYHRIILCSASRRVLGAEMSEGNYIQGAGDDSEGWARGLTPALFWHHKDELLNTPESELEALIQRLIVDARKDSDQATSATAFVRIAPTSNLHVGKAALAPRSFSSSEPGLAEHDAKAMSGNPAGMNRAFSKDGTETKKFDIVINCHKTDDDDDDDTSTTLPAGTTTKLDLACRTGKLGSRDLREKLGLVRDVVQDRLKRHHHPNPAASILVTCETGRDLCVGVALMLLCLFYDDHGGQVKRYADLHGTSSTTMGSNGIHARSPSVGTVVDKSLVRRRLAWIVSSHPDASPSRTTLQSVNAFLIERPR